ncbi:MAG TPA: endonuclease/exonuclease/phosphatase family protein [Candidatus Saccharimonadia bacterium]|nr:endonuclease/exonuclease/phosphatase family protein [Candidatus Saccharimonadia bacterium]
MSLRVLQWNIWYNEDIANVVRTLKGIDADVVCLQELTQNYLEQSHSDTVSYVARQLGFSCHASKPMGRDDVERKQLNAIFSRFPLTNKNQAWINTPVGTGGASDEYRAYIEATVLIKGWKVRVATTHMSYVDRFMITDRKKQETDLLVSQIEGKSPLILTGDFNAAPDSCTVKHIEQHLRNAGPEYGDNTWTTKPFKYHDFEENDLNWRLDYIFASEDVKVQSSEIIDTKYSDHLPILATFQAGGS